MGRNKKDYKEADKYFLVNKNDIDLKEIKVRLPEPPPITKIDGYGLPPKEQKFTRTAMPSRLTVLYERAIEILRKREINKKTDRVTGQKILSETWRLLNENKHNYKKEIEWIEKQIYHLFNGYWCFINGKPTYMDGWHYIYCNFWKMLDLNTNDGYPEYRDRDRRWFLFSRYSYTTTEDENGNDVGYRTSFGFMVPKHRRAGDTHKALCIGYLITIFKRGAHMGIQSFDDSNAAEHYSDKLLPAWTHLPFFLKPIWYGTNVPQHEMSFNLPRGKAYGKSLGSKITYATTSHRKFYDGRKLYFYQGEEQGKTIQENIYERWGVVKHTLSQGDGAIIHGLTIQPSTVADMVDQGGMNYYFLGEDSDFYDRNPTTHQTPSGLFRLFIPAWDGMEGYIGPYGESIIDNPTPEQIAFTNKEHGAKERILSTRKKYLDKGTPESKAKYREHVMLFPTSWAEAFRVTSGAIGFDEEILDKRIEELRRKSETIRGNYEWKNGVKDSKVIFTPNEDGRWEVSKQLGETESSLKHKDTWYNPIKDEEEVVWYPLHPAKYTLGADPFKFSTKGEAQLRQDKSIMSDGGGAMLRERDPSVDTGDIRSEWETEGFVATYRYRAASDDEFAEDMLMAAIYWGSLVFSENNIGTVNKHFIKRGYAGYLKYEIDPVSGRQKDTPGYYIGGASKIEALGLLRNYIAYRGHKEKHLSLLLECKAIKGIEQVTNFDILAAAMAALKGSASSYAQALESFDKEDPDISQAFPLHEY